MAPNYPSGDQVSAAGATVTKPFLLSLLAASIVLLITLKRKRTAASKLPPLPPTPPSWPLIGNLPEVMFHSKPMFRWVHDVMKEMNTDTCLIRLPAGGPTIVPVLDPAIAREMLRKHDASFADRPTSFGSHVISGGYVTAVLGPHNDQWRKMRKVMTSEIVSPARLPFPTRLHKDKLETEFAKFMAMLKQLNISITFVEALSVDLRIATQHYCGNVMRKMLFGRRFFGEPTSDGGPGPMEVKHVEALFTGLKYLYFSGVSDYLPWLRGWDVDGKEKIVREADKTIKALQNPIIDERIRQWRSGERKEIDDLIDVLVTLKDDVDRKPLLTPQEIKSQAAELMMAVIDNPSNAVEWTMAELINQPDLMAKAVEEIDRVVGKESRLVHESDFGSLHYVKACVREAFRLHPVYPFNVPHVSTCDTVVAGYLIPKGSHALLSRYGLGRNPEVWTDPLKFDPDRHLDGTGDHNSVVLAEHDLRFISFSTGRRGCVAAVLGTCMTTMLLARLLQCFTWAPLEDGKGVIDLAEAKDELFLATPLVAFPKPRLAPHLYPKTN
ncbi:unnamed protein product [Linum tenue]|uniref:Cytochrome P450 n=1 Tax=Linum tenue TaxID=586396 RepID=A0AAV0GWB4_9ROSI|nr:unnamed protein product [Linum tenue]